jgi:quercetin dioxygenase-like cupin family protein
MAKVVPTTSLPDSGSSHRFDGAVHDAPVSFFLTHSEPGDGPGPHTHPYAETFIVQEGQATFTVGDETIEARAGDIVVAPADVPHAFVNPGPGVLRSVNIHPVPEMETVWL